MHTLMHIHTYITYIHNMHTYIHTYYSRYLKRPAEGIGCPGAGVTDSPELPEMGAGT